jgi:hypothetical protein
MRGYKIYFHRPRIYFSGLKDYFDRPKVYFDGS